LCENYVPVNVLEQFARFNRLANNLAALRPAALTRATLFSVVQGAGWLPTHASDPSVDIVILTYMMEWVKNTGYEWVSLTNGVLWVEPPWWNAIAANDQAEIEWCYMNAQPATEADWITRYNAIHIEWFTNFGMEYLVDPARV
jgi:hypothetical protein